MYDELIKSLKAYINCEAYFEKNGDCDGCPMPHKTEPGKEFQRECVDFESRFIPICATALTSLISQVSNLTTENAMLERDIQRVEAELAAAVEDLKIHGGCPSCKYKLKENDGPCKRFKMDMDKYCRCLNYEWRGYHNGEVDKTMERLTGDFEEDWPKINAYKEKVHGTQKENNDADRK